MCSERNEDNEDKHWLDVSLSSDKSSFESRSPLVLNPWLLRVEVDQAVTDFRPKQSPLGG